MASKGVHASQMKTNAQGLDKEIWAKIEGKWDDVRGENVLKWIAAVTGIPITIDPSQPLQDVFFDALRSGWQLFMLMKKLDEAALKKANNGRSLKKFKATKLAFKSREQISLFNAAGKSFGMKSTFQTQDLYEKENLNNVVNAIYELYGMIVAKGDFSGPALGGGYKVSEENKRHFSEETLRKGKSFVPKWNQGSIAVDRGEQLDGTGIVKTAGNRDWKASHEPTALSRGGIAVDKGNILDSYGIVKTAGSENWRASSEPTKMSQGSIAVDKGISLDSIIRDPNTDYHASSEPTALTKGAPAPATSAHLDSHGIGGTYQA